MGVNFSERVLIFQCASDKLLGVLTTPPKSCTTGVIVVVGGPQYRIGSHRQFLLLSRALASSGYSVMRFDHSGMGDSTGSLGNFETLTENISAAIDAFQQQSPHVIRVVLWGLCDAASASLLYWDATHDSRICGLVLLNPWVRSEATLAKTHIKHYYGQRLLQVEFWRKVFSGNLGLVQALSGFVSSLVRAWLAASSTKKVATLPFQLKMLRALESFTGQILLILSGDDLTAKEFLEAIRSDSFGVVALESSRLERFDIAGADHTFSNSEWRQLVELATINWMERFDRGNTKNEGVEVCRANP